MLRLTLDADVKLEPDPVALTARVGAGAANGQGAAEQAARALAELARGGIVVDNFSLGQPSLDEVFLALTGHDTHETKNSEVSEDSNDSNRSDDSNDEVAA